MKRFLVGCALAMAVLAASEQRASANGSGSWGFNIGVDVGFKFGWWSNRCCNCCPNGYGYPGYGPPGYGPPVYPGYPDHAGMPHADGYANVPTSAPAAAPAAPAAPAKPATSGAQQVGYYYYSTGYGYYPSYGYGYGYSPSYWYGY